MRNAKTNIQRVTIEIAILNNNQVISEPKNPKKSLKTVRAVILYLCGVRRPGRPEAAVAAGCPWWRMVSGGVRPAAVLRSQEQVLN